MGSLVTGGEEEGCQKEVSVKRSEKVYSFARSRTFMEGVAIATITSLPRWHMAQSLFSEKLNPDGSKARPSSNSGIGHAIRSCLADTAYILGGNCDLVDYVLRDFADFERSSFEIKVSRALLRTVVYLLSANCGNFLVIPWRYYLFRF